MASPLQVGITGGIGSGKSLVSRIFMCLGAPVYDADSRAKTLMSTDAQLAAAIKKEFGPLSYRPDGKLDRAYLSKVTFGKSDRLEKLNNLVHPRVAVDYAQWLKEHSKFNYVLREAALLYEAGAFKTIDKMIVVSAPENLKIRRVLARDPQRSREEVKAIMSSQWPDEEKLKRADFIVYNDNQHLVIPQVLMLHNQFMAMRVNRT
ncbi:MAG TPA: dephospho-CoA kinase [Cyclobacteriaceae bacterium]|nr:dephospho-CoA kinase [Cyclobacteriaceae bacterium]